MINLLRRLMGHDDKFFALLEASAAEARASVQHTMGKGDRIGVSVDVRHTRSMLSADYDGWTGGLFGTFKPATFSQPDKKEH